MSEIQFNRTFTPRYGVVETIAPGTRRILANNPGPFTFHGTGTYLIGQGEVAVIDPGPAIPSHIENILSALGPTETITHILITHTHTDHSAGAALLKAQTGAPTFGFAPHATGDIDADSMEAGVDRDFEPDFAVQDGEHLRSGDWDIEAVHTPGHCSNHLCFSYKNQNLLFCGDHLMAWSTTVIIPPDGSVRQYLQSLEKLKTRKEKTYWPTHGAEIANPLRFIDQVIRHRKERIYRINASVREGCHDPGAIRQRLYSDIAPSLYKAAELSILASLQYLIEEKAVIRVNQESGATGFFATDRRRP